MTSEFKTDRTKPSAFTEYPVYRGYLGVTCHNCGKGNTTVEVFKGEITTNCMSCSRSGHTIPPMMLRRFKEILNGTRTTTNSDPKL